MVSSQHLHHNSDSHGASTQKESSLSDSCSNTKKSIIKLAMLRMTSQIWSRLYVLCGVLLPEFVTHDRYGTTRTSRERKFPFRICSIVSVPVGQRAFLLTVLTVRTVNASHNQSQQRGNASNIPHNQPGERALNAEVFSLTF
jgi:hypothetical protein